MGLSKRYQKEEKTKKLHRKAALSRKYAQNEDKSIASLGDQLIRNDEHKRSKEK